MADTQNCDFDEDALVDALWETLAAPRGRDIIKKEHDEKHKRGPVNARVEKRILEIGELIAEDLDKT